MQIATPKHPEDHEDREIDCQEALEPAFLAIFRDLEQTGLSAQAALQASFPMDSDDMIAEQLRSLAAWATQAGWQDAESRSAIRKLAAYRVLSLEAPEDAEARVSALIRTVQ